MGEGGASRKKEPKCPRLDQLCYDIENKNGGGGASREKESAKISKARSVMLGYRKLTGVNKWNSGESHKARETL